jgi:lipooligosaccharide transport system permease protein
VTARTLLGVGRVAPLANVRGLVLVERKAMVYKRVWWVFLSGLVEPFFYLTGIGFGVGSLVGTVEVGGHVLSYPVFVAPALMASAAMNGAIYDSTFALFFNLKYSRVYDAVLATPIGAADVAVGELTWALARGALYAAAFLAIMTAMGLVRSPLGLLALPGAVLVGYCFGGIGSAATTFMRSWQDFDLINLALMPLFLFSATFFPAAIYPGPLRVLAELSPLTRGVDLLRGLTTGELQPLMAADALYLAVLGTIGLILTSRRLGRLLLR